MASKARAKEQKELSSGSIAPLDGILSAWIESQFRGETPQAIDVYPLEKGIHRELRLCHYDVKPNEKIGAERAVELANELFSACQVHCDALAKPALYKGRKSYQFSVIDDRRGGLAAPVGSHVITLEPRVHRPGIAEAGDDKDDDEGTETTARSMMERVFKDIVDKDERGTDRIGEQVGEVLILLKDSLKDREEQNSKLASQVLDVLQKYAGTLERLAERRVEERAVEIDALNAAENRIDQAARRNRENMWTDVTRGAMTESISVLGKLLPGFGQLFLAQMTGQPPPPPPQLGAPAPAAGAAAAPALPPAPDEKALILRFVQAARAHRIDDTHTAAEKLFGKDDDATGAILEPGVFSRPQVAILAGVAEGKLGPEALDALLPDSGKPEAVSIMQGVSAMAYLTPAMRADLDAFMTIRKQKRGA